MSDQDQDQIAHGGVRDLNGAEMAHDDDAAADDEQKRRDLAQVLDDDDDDQTAVISLAIESSGPERLWSFGGWDADPDHGEPAASDPYIGLINLSFIWSALKRRMLVWISLALIGLLGGVGFLVALPPAQQASTSLLLASPPGSPPGTVIANDQTMIEQRVVAADALRRLGLHETPASFLSHYTAATVTDQVLTITVSETSSAAAIREANGLAATFLAFQVELLKSQNQLVNASYAQQIAASQQSLDALGKQISSLKAQLGKGHTIPQLASLEADYSQQNTALGVLKSTVEGTEATNQTALADVIAGSEVLDFAAPVKQSTKRKFALYAGGGLVGGLALGMMIVVIGTLISDRLRRRDDVARVLGAPVRLSVGPIRTSRWRPGRRGLALARHRDVQRVAAHLGNAVAPSAHGPASLAVVPVDDVLVPAVCLVSLAISCAQQGLKAVVADLCVGTPAARLLNAAEPGVREVSVRNATLTVVVPEHDSVPIAGPIRSRRSAAEPVAGACESADVVLTLASVDPALGADYLADWTTSVVAMVTAGKSSAQRVFAVGEMIRVARPQSVSAVLVGADKSDESLGLVVRPTVSREPTAAVNGMLSIPDRFLALADPDLSADSAEITIRNGTSKA